MSECFPYVASDDQEPPLPLEEVLVLPAQAEGERAEADAELDAVLSALGVFGSYVRGEAKKRSDLDVLVEFSDSEITLLQALLNKPQLFI